MKLFWMESFDHGEDWFVVAPTASAAMTFFADFEGYDIVNDEISAQFVCDLPPELGFLETDFPDEEVIAACGGEMVLFDDHDIKPHYDDKVLAMIGAETRVVKIGETIYVEGNVARSAMYYIQLQQSSS